MEHIVTLQSNVITKYDNNTIASFITPLSQRLKLDGEWGVAISEIQYTKSWYNILESRKITLMDENGKDYKVEDSIISEGHYETEEDLITTINEELDKIQMDFTNPTLEYNKLSKRVRLHVGYFDVTEEKSNVTKIYPIFGNEIASMLGFHITPFESALTISLNENTNYYVKSTSVEGLILEPKHPVEISGGYHSLYVYSDIVYPSHIGDAFAQLLRVVEVPNHLKLAKML